MAGRKTTTNAKLYKAKPFLLRCVNPATLPLVRCYSIRLPRHVVSGVSYSRQQTDSSSEHYTGELSLMMADAL